MNKAPLTKREHQDKDREVILSSYKSGSQSIAQAALEIPSCGAGRVIDLKPYFSIHPYFIVKHSLGWISIGIACAIAWYLLLVNPIMALPLSESSYEMLSFSLRFGCLMPFFAVWYWREYRRHLQIHVEGFRLVAVTGVFFRSVDSRPLCQICCLSVEQGLFGQLLNLFDVKYYCAFGVVKPSYLVLPCLRKEDAFVMEKYLNTQMGRFVSPSADALKVEAFQSSYVH